MQVHVYCMKHNTFCCVLVPQRRETWLEYLWELIDCCCCKFRWKALEISLSLFMMLWLLETRSSYPLFCANWMFITWILPLWLNVLYCKQMGSNQPVLRHYEGGGSTAVSLFLNAANFTSSQSYGYKQTLIFTIPTKSSSWPASINTQILLFISLWWTDK